MTLSLKLLLKYFSEFLKDESAQANTEYIMLLVIAVSSFLLLYSKLLSPLVGRLRQSLSDKINGAFFSGDFHRLSISR